MILGIKAETTLIYLKTTQKLNDCSRHLKGGQEESNILYTANMLFSFNLWLHFVFVKKYKSQCSCIWLKMHVFILHQDIISRQI